MDRAAAAARAELGSLARGLLVPVVGVPASDLRDGFEQPRVGHRHEAIDIMAARGTPVVSATDGRLLKLHRSKAGGLMVYAADTSDRFILMYAHLDRYAPGLVPGAALRRGQLLGYVGSTGNARPEAPHLHFAVARGTPSARWWKGTPVNPFPLLAHGQTLAALTAPRNPARLDDAAPDAPTAAAAEAPSTAMLVPLVPARVGPRVVTVTRATRATRATKAAGPVKAGGVRRKAAAAPRAPRARAAARATAKRSAARRVRRGGT